MRYQKKNKKGQCPKNFLRKNFRGQMNLSFGTIFSIILIIVFIAFAIFGIKKFLDTSQFAQVEKFKSDLQTDIDALWKGEYGSSRMEYSLPKKISKVCFADDNYENIYFKPIPNDFRGGLLKHVDFDKTIVPITASELCINTKDGEINLLIKKNAGENLITIAK